MESPGFVLSKKRYAQATGWLAAIVEKSLGVPLSPETKRQWERLGLAIHAVDNRIDSIRNPEERRAFLRALAVAVRKRDAGFSSPDAVLQEAMQIVAELFAALTTDRAAFFERTLLALLAVTEKAKNAKDPKAFIAIRALEGQLTGKLFAPFLPEGIAPAAEKRAGKILARLGRGSTLLDSLCDLKKDHAKGETQMLPSAGNRARIASALFHETVRLAGKVRIPLAVAKEVAEATLLRRIIPRKK